MLAIFEGCETLASATAPFRFYSTALRREAFRFCTILNRKTAI